MSCDLCSSGENGVTVDGKEVDEAMLVADNQGEPTVVSSGNLSFYVIFRESYALRIKDSQAPTLQNFTGVPNYDFQPDWRYEALLSRRLKVKP